MTRRQLHVLCVAGTVAIALVSVRAAQNPGGRGGPPQAGAAPGGAISVLPVQGNITLISSAEGNVVVQTGKDLVLLVDTPPAALVPQVMDEIRKISPRPLRFILNTSIDQARWGGNAALLGPAAARGIPLGAGAGVGRPNIIAFESVLNRMSDQTPPVPPAAQPTTTYYQASMDFSSNGEAVFLYHRPAAYSDSDSIVLFRGSDVVATGNVFTPGRFPTIDLQRGGSITGLVAALGFIIELAVPAAFEDGGTRIIPAAGRVAEETDVAEYRDMVAIIRDRVMDGIKKKMTIEQVVASKPSRDYDAEYSASQADADRFVQTMYRSLSAPAAAARPGGRP
jgi:hypothetical protein